VGYEAATSTALRGSATVAKRAALAAQFTHLERQGIVKGLLVARPAPAFAQTTSDLMFTEMSLVRLALVAGL
jgi:hypothetical protein